MPRVAGQGGRVWVRAARPVPFVGVRLEACATAGWWRVTDATRRLLDPTAPLVARAHSGDGWDDVDVVETSPIDGRLLLPSLPSGSDVVADGAFFPHSLLGNFAVWDLETDVRVQDTSTLDAPFQRQTSVIAAAVVRVAGCTFDTAAAAARGPLVVDMVVGERLAHRGVGRPAADTPDELHVHFAAGDIALATA